MSSIHQIRSGILLFAVVVAVSVCVFSHNPMYVKADDTVRTSENGVWSYIVLDETKIRITALDNTKTEKLFDGNIYTGIVTIPSTIDEYQVYEIGDVNGDSSTKGVFENLKGVKDKADGEGYPIKQLVIPYGVVTLGTNCFKNVDCEEIIIPSSVKTIGVSCFQDSKILRITLPDSLESIGELAFGRCNSLGEVNFGKGLKEIGSKAFMWCTSLTAVNIPDSVITLGEAVFADCTAVTSLTIGSGIKELPASSFYGCSSLESVVLPDSVVSIGSNVFKGCSKLSDITLSGSIQTIGNDAFLTNYIGVSSSENGNTIWHDEEIEDAVKLGITIPKELTDVSTLNLTVYKNVTFKVYEGNSTVINYFTNNSVTNYITYSGSSDNNSDKGENTGTKTEDGGTSKTEGGTSDDTTPEDKGQGTADNTKSTSSDKVEYNVGQTYSSGSYTYKLLSKNTASFTGITNKKLTRVNIPATVKFDKTSYKVTEIGSAAFKGNKKIKQITIGKNVKKVGSKAFMNCKKLKKMAIKTKNLKSIGKQAFKGVKFGSKGVDITVPKGKKKKYTKLIIKAR